MYTRDISLLSVIHFTIIFSWFLICLHCAMQWILSLSDQIYKSFITYGLWDIVSHNASVYTQVLEEFIHVFLQYVFRFMFIRYLIHFNIFSFLWVKNGSSLSFSICPTTIFLKVYFRPSNLNVCAQSLSCIWLFATLWTVAHPAPLSMGIFRQEYQNWLPFLPPGEFEYYHYQKNFIYSTALGVNCIMQDLLSRCADSLVVALGLSGPSACGILVPGPGIKPVFPALQGRFFTTGPPGKPFCLQCLVHIIYPRNQLAETDKLTHVYLSQEGSHLQVLIIVVSLP